MTIRPTRRHFLGKIAAAGVFGAAAPALALTTDGAAALVNGMVAEINRVINSGKSESAMYNDFARILVKYGDIGTVAIYALGPDARSASAAQKKAFTQAFVGYISRKYGKRFREFIGGQIVVNSARPISNKGRFEVKCTAVLRGEAPFAVDFLVSSQSGQDRFYDMLVEGVSLLRSERTEIGAMIDRRGGDLNAMIADLNRAG